MPELIQATALFRAGPGADLHRVLADSHRVRPDLQWKSAKSHWVLGDLQWIAARCHWVGGDSHRSPAGFHRVLEGFPWVRADCHWESVRTQCKRPPLGLEIR